MCGGRSKLRLISSCRVTLPACIPLTRKPPQDARAKIQRLLVTGDNRLKQGVAPEKARESYEQALAVAREAGLEEAVRPLVELRLADLERLDRESPRSAEPES